MPEKKKDLYIELGTTGLKRQGGRIQETFLRELIGAAGQKVRKRMAETDPTFGAILFAIEQIVRSAPWKVEERGEGKNVQEAAEFVDGCRNDMSQSWESFISDILTMLTFGWCLPPEQEIRDGLGCSKKIKDCSVGDEVLTGTGKTRKVIRTFSRAFDGKLVKIGIRGYPEAIRLTPEHRILTEKGWKQAGNLKKNDLLLRPRLPLEEGGDFLSGWLVGVFLAEGHIRRDAKSTVIFSINIDESNELVENLEKWESQNTISIEKEVKALQATGINVSQIAENTGHKYYLVRDILDGIRSKKLRGEGAHIQRPPSVQKRGDKATRVMFSKKEFRALIEEWVYVQRGNHGEGARSKKLRKLSLKAEFARGIWEGWLWGDADRFTGVTTSKDLAWQMQLIAGALGYPSPVWELKSSKNASYIAGKEIHSSPIYWGLGRSPQVRMTRTRTPEREEKARTLRTEKGMSFKKIGELIGVSEMTVWRWLNGPAEAKLQGLQCRVLDDFIGHPITSIEKEDYNGLVYDIEVENDHTFLAGPVTISNSYHEICWKKRQGEQEKLPSSQFNDGRIGIRKLPTRAQDTLFRWEFDDEGGIAGMWQSAAPYYTPTFIPIEKSLLFRTKATKGNPEGKSILDSAYSAWYKEMHLEEILLIGIERDLAGYPVIHVPASILIHPDKTGVLQVYETMIKNIRRDEQEGAILPYDPAAPEAYKLELLSTGSRRQFDVLDVMKHFNLQKMQTVLADAILIGHENVGSWALYTGKLGMFEVAVMGWLDAIKGVLNSHLVPRLMKANKATFSGLDEYPVITYSMPKVPELKDVIETIKALATAGADLFPNADLMNAVLSRAGLPEISQEELQKQSAGLDWIER